MTTLPKLLIFRNGQLLYTGRLGGDKLSLPPPRPRVLLLEPNFKDQLITEQVFRRCRIDSDLVTNSHRGRSYDVIFVSSNASPDDCARLEKNSSGRLIALLRGDLPPHVAKLVDGVLKANPLRADALDFLIPKSQTLGLTPEKLLETIDGHDGLPDDGIRSLPDDGIRSLITSHLDAY